MSDIRKVTVPAGSADAVPAGWTRCAARRHATPDGTRAERALLAGRRYADRPPSSSARQTATMSTSPTSRPSSMTGRCGSQSSSIRPAASATEVPGCTTAGRLRCSWLIRVSLRSRPSATAWLTSASVMTAIGMRPSSLVTTSALSFARFIRYAAEATWASGSTVVVAGRMSAPTVTVAVGHRHSSGVPGRSRSLCAPRCRIGTPASRSPAPNGGRPPPELRSDHVGIRPDRARPPSSSWASAAPGKSTVAATLVDRLGWEFAEGDDFHPAANVEKMRAGHPLDDEDRWPWLRTLAAWIGEHEQAGRNVVVTCSALKRSYRDLLCDGHPSVWFAHVTADPELIRERIEHRTGPLHAAPRCSTASWPPSSRWRTTNPGARDLRRRSRRRRSSTELLAALDAERGLHLSTQEAPS